MRPTSPQPEHGDMPAQVASLDHALLKLGAFTTSMLDVAPGDLR